MKVHNNIIYIYIYRKLVRTLLRSIISGSDERKIRFFHSAYLRVFVIWVGQGPTRTGGASPIKASISLRERLFFIAKLTTLFPLSRRLLSYCMFDRLILNKLGAAGSSLHMHGLASCLTLAGRPQTSTYHENFST